MLNVLENIIGRLLFAIIPAIIWNVASVVITYALYKIKGRDIPDDYTDNFTYMLITNYILIFLYLLFFYKQTINLF